MKKTCKDCKHFLLVDIPHFGLCDLENDYEEKYKSQTACKKYEPIEDKQDKSMTEGEKNV